MMKNILIAPDKFKGTLTAAQAAEAIAAGIRGSCPEASLRLCPMADGGEGTAEIIAAAKGWLPVEIPAENAIGEPVTATVYMSDDRKNAVMDSSAVIGLQLIPREKRNPWLSSSYPLGKVAAQLLATGTEHISIGIGGTATTDAGLGFLQALGARLYTADGLLERPFRTSDLMALMAVDFSGLPSGEHFTGLADVDVPLDDNDGYPSMLMFAPQKGIQDDAVIVLKMGLDRLYERVRWLPGYPNLETKFGGAGGGLGFAVAGVLGADTVFGADAILSLTQPFIPEPDMVITGEGSYDTQSLQGKATDIIAGHAAALGIPCCILAGRVEPGLENTFVRSVTPAGVIPTPQQAAEYLETAAENLFKQ